ncbi:MAG: carbon starvation CstA family protein [Prevotellaceae bacterium]|nr:carbon starvation CstA family protein [Prevotellaceae bacterium]
MLSFTICLIALVVGYFTYGKYVEKVFAPDGRVTPAVSMADGVDYIVMPNWKVFLIQFLNIAGTGPIFGAIMGAKFGPSSYLWIVFGCIFAGAVHDFLIGMLSMRNNGASLPSIVGKYLGNKAERTILIFSVFLLMILGSVFVYSPAEILEMFGGTTAMWVVAIFLYYIVATLLPIDKLIGRVYPLFAVALLFMALALVVVLVLKWPSIPEIWDGLGNKAVATDPNFKDQLFPCLFITIACGAISGFHATQSPLMARCMRSEKMGRPIFYGAMITEGIVALVWAAVSSYFFYGNPTPGYSLFEATKELGLSTSAPKVVYLMCEDWLGVVGGILAVLGVVAAPITSGDTAFRSARLIVAEALHFEQKSIRKRLLICIPMFLACLALLFWQVDNPDGFNIVWKYFGWANQTLAVFGLWAITAYFAREGKPYVITLIPALFMTLVCSTFLFVSYQAFGMAEMVGYPLGIAVMVAAYYMFRSWHSRYKKYNVEK